MNGSTHQFKPPVIGIFDSGVGGFTIVAELLQRRSDWSTVYLADQAMFPYGEKSPDMICDRVVALATHWVRQMAIDVLVVACNTASTICLPALRQALNIPVVGVVPAVKPAALASRSKVIGVLATEETVRRPYLDALIAEHCQGVKVLRHGSQDLVRLAEEMNGPGGAVDGGVLLDAIQPLFAQSVEQTMDTVVLGCTHFPLLLAELKKVAPWPVQWIDSTHAIVDRVVQVAGMSAAHRGELSEGMRLALFTGHDLKGHRALDQLNFQWQRFGGIPAP